jgi:hypothetical protein
MVALHGGCSPSPSPQLHGERFYGKRHHDICLHQALSPLFARLTRFHDWFNDPVPHEERKEADGLDYRKLTPNTCARTWPEVSVTLIIEAKESYETHRY